MSNHFIKICEHCKAVISQCRCPGPKATLYGTCSKCKIEHLTDAMFDDILATQKVLEDHVEVEE